MIAVATLSAAGLRFWAFGRLSLSHFDEGIYAYSGLWIVQGKASYSIDPMVIAYAPPGFPILIGLSYFAFGISDYSAILVATVSGVATIPVVGWLGRRTFGPGAGGAAALLASLAMAHVAFSRKALTDGPFLFLWLTSLGLGVRFLEKPGLGRALGLGLAVGLAQNVKYNGWLAGAIVIIAALAGPALHRDERRAGPLLRTLGWGMVATFTAAIAYAPWYRFVSFHGGYASLLAHHRSYLGGITTWWSHQKTQLGEAFALSGEAIWGAIAWILAWTAHSLAATGDGRSRALTLRSSAPWLAMLSLGAAFAMTQSYFTWWVGAAWSPWLLRFDRKASRILASAWIVMAIMTPFYHPYARLWLPLHAAGWLMMAGIFTEIRGLNADMRRGPTSGRRDRVLLVGAVLACMFAAAGQVGLAHPRRFSWSWVLNPSPRTLRSFAFETVPTTIPREGTPIRLFARRPLAFYLSQLGRYPILLEPSTDRLLQPGPPGTWAILDEGVLGERFSSLPGGWPGGVVSMEVDPITLLDIRPYSAFNSNGSTLDRNVRVHLWRPVLRELFEP